MQARIKRATIRGNSKAAPINHIISPKNHPSQGFSDRQSCVECAYRKNQTSCSPDMISQQATLAHASRSRHDFKPAEGTLRTQKVKPAIQYRACCQNRLTTTGHRHDCCLVLNLPGKCLQCRIPDAEKHAPSECRMAGESRHG